MLRKKSSVASPSDIFLLEERKNGKKHFWGQGGDYGFFQSPHKKRKQSLISHRYKDTNVRQETPKQVITPFPQIATSQHKFQQNSTERFNQMRIKTEADNSIDYNQSIEYNQNIEHKFNQGLIEKIKKKIQQQIFEGKRSRLQMVRNIQLNNQNQRSSRLEDCVEKRQNRTQLSMQQNPEEGRKLPIFYAKRKIRRENPTFSNSMFYPLSCYRDQQ